MSLLSIGGKAYGYVTSGVGWDGPGLGHADVSWFLASETVDISRAEQLNIIHVALNDWASYADISFTEATAAGGLNQIDFYLGANSRDTNGYWGYGYYPGSTVRSGDIYIDDDLDGNLSAPRWTAGTTTPAHWTHNGTNWITADLYFLLHHEVGHALGMGHPLGEGDNLAAGAVMNPYFGWDNDGDVGNLAYATLQPDDIAGIRSLYGSIPEPTALILAGFGFSLISMRRIC